MFVLFAFVDSVYFFSSNLKLKGIKEFGS